MLQVALSVREEASRTLFNATLLGSQAEELDMNVTAAEERGAELVGVATRSEEAIAMAIEKSEMASSDANILQTEIEQLFVSDSFSINVK